MSLISVFFGKFEYSYLLWQICPMDVLNSIEQEKRQYDQINRTKIPQKHCEIEI